AAGSADPDNPFATDEEKMAGAGSRTWSDRDGKIKIEAKLAKGEDGKEVLHRADGKDGSVPLDKLSDEDQKEVEKIMPAKADGDKQAAGDGTEGTIMTGSGKMPIVTTDVGKARTLDLNGARAWTYTPDVAPDGEKLPNSRVPLKEVDFFDHLKSILLVP